MRVAGVFVLLFVLFYVVCRLRLGRPIVLTLGLCGLRWGELEGLQAGDVDLKRQRIHVRRSATEVCHEIVVDVTKTGEKRTVIFPRLLQSCLEDACDAMDGLLVRAIGEG